MSYTITNTAGGPVATVSDGTIDNSTSLQLVGKNTPSYGLPLNENFVKLLENHAQPAPGPISPIPGQLWWDTDSNSLKAYNSAGWHRLGQVRVNASASVASGEAPASLGDLWYDTANGQLKIYDSTWTVVGPPSSSGQGLSGTIVGNVVATSGPDRTVVSLYSGAARVAIISQNTTFTIGESIPGFSVIKPGITLASPTQIAGIQFTGTASNADLLDSLNSTDFMRATANTATTGTVAVNTNFGLTVGAAQDVKISIASTNGIIENQNNAGTLVMKVRDSGGTPANALTISGTGASTFSNNLTATGNLIVSSTTESSSAITGAAIISGGIGVAKNANIGGNLIVAGNANITGNLGVTGNFTLTGTQSFNGNVALGDATADRISFNGQVNTDILPAANASYNLGNASLNWGTIYGISTRAQYADLAERYESDREYPVGTVMCIGGDAEVSCATLTDDVFGVVSHAPAYLMNSAAGTDATHPGIALIGRVPVRVVGQCNKGDKLVVGPAGVAIKHVPMDILDHENPPPTITQDQLVGRALADKYTEEEELIEVVLTAH